MIAALGLAEFAGHGFANPWGAPALVAGGALVVVGFALAVGAVFDLRAGLSPFPKPLADAPLVETGAFRWILHPIYTGLLLASAGWGLSSGSIWALVATWILALVLDAKSRREEAWLVATHPGYEGYRRRTRRFAPFVY